MFYLDSLDLTAQPEGQEEVRTSVVHRQFMDIFHQHGSAWFELRSRPFAVRQLGGVRVQLLSRSGTWKQGLVLDTVRVLRA